MNTEIIDFSLARVEQKKYSTPRGGFNRSFSRSKTYFETSWRLYSDGPDNQSTWEWLQSIHCLKSRFLKIQQNLLWSEFRDGMVDLCFSWLIADSIGRNRLNSTPSMADRRLSYSSEVLRYQRQLFPLFIGKEMVSYRHHNLLDCKRFVYFSLRNNRYDLLCARSCSCRCVRLPLFVLVRVSV